MSSVSLCVKAFITTVGCVIAISSTNYDKTVEVEDERRRSSVDNKYTVVPHNFIIDDTSHTTQLT